jgi:hypothetical protein
MLRNTKKYKSPFGGLSESGDSVRFGGLGQQAAGSSRQLTVADQEQQQQTDRVTAWMRLGDSCTDAS